MVPMTNINNIDEYGEIMLNKMYVGTYLSDSIGHEAINLFKTDKGENYIYAQPYGIIDKAKHQHLKTILLVRKSGVKDKVEVIAKVTGIHIIETNSRAEQNDYIEKNHIYYGGKSVIDIFAQNKTNQKQQAFVTFKVDNIQKAVKPFSIECGQFRNTMFCNKNKKSDLYSKLIEDINDVSKWEKGNSTKQIVLEDLKPEEPNFLHIIRKDYDELIFSNLFQYFFNKNKALFAKKFIKEFLEIDLSENFKIEREKFHIDMLISDENNVIVIENKIKSGINGQSANRKVNETDKIQSQLEKYYQIIANAKVEDNKEKLKEYIGKKAKFVIFLPDYNDINLSKFSHGENYKPIKYSAIYEYFYSNQNLFKECLSDVEKRYFNEFLNALKKHIEKTDKSLEKEMFRRFMNRIIELY